MTSYGILKLRVYGYTVTRSKVVKRWWLVRLYV